MSEDRTYGGAIGAFPYAFRTSDSRLFRMYVVLSGVLAALLIVFFVLALAVWIEATVRQSAVEALSRSFLVLVWLIIVAPLIAPVLLVARRHRRGLRVAPKYDVSLAIAGYLFIVAVYVGLLIAVPEGQRETPTGVIAPIVEVLYALPQPVGVIPPLSAAALIVLLHRVLGRGERDPSTGEGDPSNHLE